MSQVEEKDPLDDDEEGEESAEAEHVWMWREPARTFRLPLGFKLSSGAYARDVEIAPMDGWSEDKLMHSGEGNKREAAERLSEALSRSIVRIGPMERDALSTTKKAPKFFSPELDRMPIQNRMLLVIRLRQLSVHTPSENLSGHKFSFGLPCPFCKKHTENVYTRLDTLPVVELPDSFCQEETHKYEADGHEIEWRTLTGKDLPRLTKAAEEADSLLSALLFVSTVSVDGEKPRGFDTFKDLPKAVRLGLKNAIDKGGVDIQIKVTCQNKRKCGREFVAPLPWQEQSFFFPLPPE